MLIELFISLATLDAIRKNEIPYAKATVKECVSERERDWLTKHEPNW